MPALSVIVPSRKIENLGPCLWMVRSFESSLSVIVIDDGIEWEGSCRWPIGQWMPQRIDGEQPFVFARNCNRGIKAAGGNDVILLNDDALLKVPGGFRAMQRQWIENPEYGLIASTVDKCGTPCQHRQRETGLREATDPMVAFICVFIPRSTIDKVGLLDERFGVNAGSDCPAYGVEDDDYCWRVRAAGLKLGVSDSCFVTHTELPSTFGFRDAKPGERKAADILPHKKLFREKHGVDPHAWCR